MKSVLEYLLYNGISKESYHKVRSDVVEVNRNNVIIYSYILIGGMGLLFMLSLFIDVLAFNRSSYIAATIFGVIMLFVSKGPAKRSAAITYFCEYITICFLLMFGVVLGTFVEPNQASISYGVLLFVAPLLFTDLAIKINTLTILSLIVYVFCAQATQDSSMFAFNMSAIIPYGITNLLLTSVTSKMKIERIMFAHDNKILSEVDQLTGLLNRRRFEKDVAILQQEEEKQICVCSFDVNDLKHANDFFGHKAGDELILAASKAIYEVVGKYGQSYRVGGDEFMAILTKNLPTHDEFFDGIAEQEKSYRSGYDFELTIAGGMATGSNKNIRNLIYQSDQMMYDYKKRYYSNSNKDRRKR